MEARTTFRVTYCDSDGPVGDDYWDMLSQAEERFRMLSESGKYTSLFLEEVSYQPLKTWHDAKIPGLV